MKGSVVILDTNAYSRLMQGEERVIRVANAAKRVLLCSAVLGELESGFRSGSRYDQNKRELKEFCDDYRHTIIEAYVSIGFTIEFLIP